MKHTYSIKMCAALWTVVGIICFASAPVMAVEPEWWTQQKRNCGLPSNLAYNDWDGNCNNSSGAGSGSGYNGPNIWNILRSFKSSAADQANQADQQARAANEQGVQAYNRGDWATAITYFNQALQSYPDEPIYLQNLANAQANLANQQAREKAEKEAVERQRQNKVAADNMQQSIQDFAQTLNAAPVSGGLDFDGRTSGNAPEGNSGGLDFTATVATPGKSAATLSFGDPMVVDARNVSSGLPKGLDDTIANAYSSAPPGVSDRVRKGFQSVMERDWKVAKAWFQEALLRDPTNVGLKRLVALTDSSQHVDTRKADPNLQLPDADDMWILFPGLQKMKAGEAPVFTTLPDGRRVQMPQDSDMEYLFGPQAAPKATPTYIIGKDGQLIQVPENSDQESAPYMIGENGKLMELPQPKDILIMFPENSPSSTPK